jgi:hypothetical protein
MASTSIYISNCLLTPIDLFLLVERQIKSIYGLDSGSIPPALLIDIWRVQLFGGSKKMAPGVAPKIEEVFI